MSKFSMQNFGSSKSLVDSVSKVLEGRRKYRVEAKRGTMAEKQLPEAVVAWGRNEMEAISKIVQENGITKVSMNDFNIQYEGFGAEEAEKKNIDEAPGDIEYLKKIPQPGQKVRVKSNIRNPQAKKFAGKTGKVVDIDDKTIHVKIDRAKHGSMEFYPSELEVVK